jgi:hypothetical protein
MAGGGQDLGSATFRVTLDDSDLRNKLKQLKTDIEGLKVGPVKLNPDGTGTRSKTNTDDAAKKKDAAAEARRQGALQTLESKRFRIARQINQLEERGVNVDRLRSKLEKDRFSTGTKSSLAQLQAANQTTRQLSRQVALAKDLADKNKRAATEATKNAKASEALAAISAAPVKNTIQRPSTFSGGASESITAKTDAQSRSARLNQQLNSLEASGVKTTKLRAQLGEATTAQARRQFGTFDQIANKLSESLRAEREKLKIQRQQSRELKSQVTEEKRIGKLNASPVRGGIGFGESPAAKAARDKENKRIANLNSSPVRGGLAFPGSPVSLEVANKAALRLARSNAVPLNGGIGIEGSPAARAAARAQEAAKNRENRRIAKENASPVRGNVNNPATPAGKAARNKELNRIARDNAAPIGGLRDSLDIIKDLNIQRSRLVRNSNQKGIPLSDNIKNDINRLAPQIRDAAGKGQIDTVKRLAKEVKLLIRAEAERLAVIKQAADALKGQKPPASPKPPGPKPPGSVPPRLTPQEREARKNAAAERRAAEKRKQEQGARLNSGLVGGAFPLMFGQGGFAAAGGAIGGTAGGGPLGFGLSLVGTFVGSQIDELNKRLGELGTALRSPIESLDVFIAQATLASSVQDKLAKTLVEGGQLGAAEQLIRTESARTVDPIIAEGIAANNEKFNRALSDTKDILGQLTAGPTSAFLAFLANLLNTVNNVPAANPDAPAGDRLAATKKKATEDKQTGQRNAALGLALGLTNPFIQVQGLVGQGQASFSEGTERAASSKEVLSLETRLTKEKQTQKSLEAAALQAKGQGRKELADTLSAQAKLAAIQAELTAGESAIAQELARNKDGRNDDKDQQFANNQRKDLRERIKLQKQLVEAESSAAAASSVIAAKKAKDLQGFEGSARILRDKELDLQLARTKTKEARSALDQSTPASRKVAADGLTVAKNNQFIAQIELDRTKLSLQNDLNKSLASEAILRKGIATQITASIAQQEAALARGDAAANPGNSVLAARAGGAEGRAFLAQNNLGVDAARRAEADIQSAIKFEVEPNKIAELQSKLQTASQATKLAMVEAGTALANKAADAAASLQSARDGLRGALDGKRGLLESNINKLPVEQQVNLKQNALADVRRGVDTGILRPDIKVNNTASLLSNANFVRQVEAANKQIAAAEAQISALNANTEALRQGGAIAVSVYSDGAGGWPRGTAERTAA